LPSFLDINHLPSTPGGYLALNSANEAKKKHFPSFGFLVPNVFAGVVFLFLFLSLSYRITQVKKKERVIGWRRKMQTSPEV
jgi:hypothetical protein